MAYFLYSNFKNVISLYSTVEVLQCATGKVSGGIVTSLLGELNKYIYERRIFYLRVLSLLSVSHWHTCVKISAGDMLISSWWQTGSAGSRNVLVVPHCWHLYLYHLSGKTGITNVILNQGVCPTVPQVNTKQGWLIPLKLVRFYILFSSLRTFCSLYAS